VLIAEEQERSMRALPSGETTISVVTLAELELGVHLAEDTDARAARIETLNRVRELYAAVPIDDAAASAFASLIAHLRQSAARAPIQDTWIAATAVAHDAAVYTQDSDFDALEGVQGLRVLRI
jgi:predicted nucleic acid-binding protein